MSFLSELFEVDPTPVGIVAFIGKLVIIVGLVLLVVWGTTMMIGLYGYRKRKPIMARPVIVVIDIFYSPIKKLLKLFRRDTRIVDDISIFLRNHINSKQFAETSMEQRVIIFPQCMRHTKCPAKMSSELGFDCEVCGLCDIADVVKVAEKVNVEVYIAPGGTFAKRVLYDSKKKRGKEAVLGVACHTDLYEGMLASRLGGIPSQGVPLLKEGCVATTVDVEEVIRVLLQGVDEETKRSILEGDASG